MSNEEFKKLSEERQNEMCRCGDNSCKYYPLKHFEKCPKCNNASFHVRVLVEKEKEDLEGVNEKSEEINSVLKEQFEKEEDEK